MPLDALTQLFPFTGQEVVMKNGAYYGESLETRMSVTIDPFQLENPNTIIIGLPGGGKSYWMKDLITQYVTRGVRAYVLDIEGEYELLCEDLGGAYLDMGIKSKHKINVLDPDPEAELPAEERAGLAGAYQNFKEWLVTAIGRPLEAPDLPILDRCYQAAFSAKGIYAEDPTTLHRPAPILSELFEVLLNEADPYALRLANELYPMARGLEAEAFNCRTNIDVRASPLVVFGLKNVPNPMKARRIRQVQQLTWNQMLTNVNLRPTLEIVDEAWFLLQHAHTASDLAERARRFRKKNGALVIATQHAEDFAHSRSAEAVLEIAASHLLFRQKPNAIDRLALLFKLLPGEARSLVTMRTGDYLFLSSNLRLLLHKQIPASRDELYTTRPADVQMYRERRRRQRK